MPQASPDCLKNIDLVVGAKGSPIQLILAGIYHLDAPTGNIPLKSAEDLARNPLVRRAIEAIGPTKVLGTLLNRAQRSDIAVGYRYKYSYGYSYTPKSLAPVKKSWLLPFRRKG